MCLSAMLPSGSNSSSSSTSDETQTSRSVLRPTDTSNSVNSSSSSGRNATASTSSSTSGSGHNEASSPSSLRRGGGSSSNDELGPSDEVKVFKDEGEDERDGGVSESLQAELLEEKSSLISESEMGKSFPPYFPVPGRFFDPNSPFGVPPYLVSPYAAAYANGLANGSALSRSPFLYATDPLSSPPPAHMGAGLRPPLYPLAHSQYPYSMLGADQLAAWHHQAASSMYQQANAAAALRSASPYSLPITSGALTSPMSRFSPTSLLPPHPGLSPGAGGLCSPVSGGSNSSGVPSSTNTVIKSERSLESSSNHHHPHHPHHHLNNNNSSSRNHSDKNSPSKSAAKKSKEPHIKKPLNAFMLYMKEMRPVVQSECTLKESAAINQILGRRWHSLSKEEQAKYYELARIERNDHMAKYPGWSARDNYAKLKKKKKRDYFPPLPPPPPPSSTSSSYSSSRLPGTPIIGVPYGSSSHGAGGMKKCRARYGLDQQDLWCKPCRRKKKCIRVQAYLDGKSNNAPGSLSLNNNSLHTNNNNNVLNANNINNHNTILNNNVSLSRSEHDKDDTNMFHSDGEEEEEDEEDSEDGTSHPGSLESPSEPSLTSPAGFSSLPSLGSPASIASPLTPGGGAESDWLRFSNGPGAFKPPSMTPPFAAAAAMQHHLAAVAAVAGSMQQRPPVGTDPRDSKNPLSISQLTGNHSHHPVHHLHAHHSIHHHPPQYHHPHGGGSVGSGHPGLSLPHPPLPPSSIHSSMIPPPSHPDKRPPLLSMT
ncbi:uncharacterized protein [Lepeophtheirus salmonis]|nr:transcription factor 7-like 2 isoform X2 [Lepeophtheirus salmonis]